jgi:hypothetical protein
MCTKMSNQSKEMPTSLPVAEDTIEGVATRLHALLDSYLGISRARKEASVGFRPTGSAIKSINADEFGVREALAETCRRVAALVVNPTDEMMTISFMVRPTRHVEIRSMGGSLLIRRRDLLWHA